MKPPGWPRYMVAKPLKAGGTAYYWRSQARDIGRGFRIPGEALGTDYATACERARLLNQHLDAWRQGRGTTKELDLQPGFGTLGWLVERYKRGRAWEKVSARSRPDYERAFNLVLGFKLATGQELRLAPLDAISARGVDKLYVALQKSERVGRRLRQANVCMVRMARAWDAVHRLYPTSVPTENPFRGVELEQNRQTTQPASRSDAYALHAALVAAGEPHLAAVPLICFEWHQRPENVLAGHLTWGDYRPSERPSAARIVHHKTGELVALPLADENGPLFPELIAYLDGLERIGVPVVLMRPAAKGAPARQFRLREARRRVRQAAAAAGLPATLTLAACRHGGLTELGDAELTEQGVMALSGHKTPGVARLYVKRTETQRLAAARKRRAWIDSTAESEQKVDKSRNRPPTAESE
jgi:integrase